MSRLLVTQYQAEVEKIIRYGGSKKETSIRNAFERLLNDYCKPRNYLLIPELDFKTKFNTTVFPDGTVKDAIRLEHGWWESKDQYDKLDVEIEKKLGKGYPDENILFEDSQTAILIQHSREQLRVSMQDAEALDRFFRWASDRLGQNGIIAFITNRSFIDSKTLMGFGSVSIANLIMFILSIPNRM